MDSISAWQYDKLQYLGSEEDDECQHFLYMPLDIYLAITSKQGKRMRDLVRLDLIEKTEESEINKKQCAIFRFTEQGRLAFAKKFDREGNLKPEYIN